MNHDGELEVRTIDGQLSIQPSAGNGVCITQVRRF